ncbi:MAG: beta-galactosidase [Clostridia bacterium]|nr:beta-galactosidase [Clostridia bacterium]
MEITYNQYGFFQDGKPWFPVMGEYQYSRSEARYWKDGIAKMKALGVNTVASYVIWIHHEEIEGEINFTGNNNLRQFVQTIKDAGMKMCLRIGPWIHGEVRNGGFPDWLMQKDFPLRCNSTGYLEVVKKFFTELYEQVEGLFIKDDGPIYAIQIENEYRGFPEDPATGKTLAGYGDEHIDTLIDVAKEVGFDVPLWLATGWGGGTTGSALPVWGGYCEAPWEDTHEELPPANGYIIADNPNDADIGSDSGRVEMEYTMADKPFPFITVEIGSGVQVTKKRRPIVYASDASALALCKLAGGCSALGYYIFHGGMNPTGKLTTFQESKTDLACSLCELPEKDYDFQTAIGQYGTVTERGKDIKLWNYFASEFGDVLSQMPTYFFDDAGNSAADFEKLRYSVRAKDGSGFVFFNNFVRHHTMPNFRLGGKTLSFADHKLVLPETELLNGQFVAFPFEMKIGDGKAKFITATPYCRIGEKYVFWAYDTDKVIVDADASARKNIVVISRQNAVNSYKFVVDGKEYLFVSEAPLYARLDGIFGVFEKGVRFGTFPRLETLPLGAKEVARDGAFTYYEMAMEKGSANVTSRLVGQTEERNEYRLDIEYDKCQDKEVRISVDFDADSADLYIDGKKENDKFYTGEPFMIELGWYGYPKSVVIKTNVAKATDEVYIERAHRFKNGKANTLIGVTATVHTRVKII